MAALTHGAWQRTEVGTRLGGQLPFTGSAKAFSAHALKPISPTCVQHVGSAQCNRRLAPSSFITVIKWRDWNVVRCLNCFFFFFPVQANMTLNTFSTCKWLHLNSGFSCSVHDNELQQLRQWKMMMVMMVINTITQMKMEMLMKNKTMMMKINAPFKFGFSMPPPRETVQDYS